MSQIEHKTALLASCDARIAYEQSKNVANKSIVTCLDNIRKAFNVDMIAQVMFAANVNADFLNRAERISARFNVYSAEKVVNIARVLAKNPQALNHYSAAIVRTCIALEKSEMTLTHKDAVAACSASIKHADSKRNAIVSKTRYAKHVAANTASTQSSSSINALQAFNVISESRDSANAVTYKLCDNDTSRAVQALCTQ